VKHLPSFSSYAEQQPPEERKIFFQENHQEFFHLLLNGLSTKTNAASLESLQKAERTASVSIFDEATFSSASHSDISAPPSAEESSSGSATPAGGSQITPGKFAERRTRASTATSPTVKKELSQSAGKKETKVKRGNTIASALLSPRWTGSPTLLDLSPSRPKTVIVLRPIFLFPLL